MTQTPTAGDPQAGDPATTPAQAATITTPTPQAGAGKTPEDYERMIAALRQENAGHRTKLKSFEEAEAARLQAQMSELEKAQKLAADTQAQLENVAAKNYRMAVREEVDELAGKFNFVLSPKKLTTMLLADEDDNPIEFEDGKPTNIEKLLEKLAKSEPDLVKSAEQQQPRTAPNIPAMSPGRSSIQQPGANQPGRVPNLFDRDLWKK